MEIFRALGAAVHDAWSRRAFDERAFSECAARVLAGAELPAPLDILRWVMAAPLLGPQLTLDASFGQPPVTVFASDRFYIEVLFWMDGATAIHQHAFAGAFRILDGASIHTRYALREEERVNDRLLLGRVERAGVELLRAGDVRPIERGRGYIHALFHLDRPSATVVVRTLGTGSEPQHEYLPPSLALCPVTTPASMTRKLQAFKLLLQLDHTAEAHDFVRQPDFEQTVRALLVAYDAVKDWDALVALAEVARAAHGGRIDLVLPALAERRRQARIMARRALVKGDEHRFLLGLLLNVRGRGAVLELVRRRFPEREPAAAIVRWVQELGELGRDALGIPVDEASLFMLRALLDGADIGGVLRRFGDEYGADEAAREAPALRELHDAFLASDTFGGLLE